MLSTAIFIPTLSCNKHILTPHYPLLPHSLQYTVYELYHPPSTIHQPSTNNNLSILLPIVLFDVFFDLLWTANYPLTPLLWMLPSQMISMIYSLYLCVSDCLYFPSKKYSTPVLTFHYHPHTSTSYLHILCPPKNAIYLQLPFHHQEYFGKRSSLLWNLLGKVHTINTRSVGIMCEVGWLWYYIFYIMIARGCTYVIRPRWINMTIRPYC